MAQVPCITTLTGAFTGVDAIAAVPVQANGQVFRLKGYGMPKIGDPDDKGDIYARVEAQLPTELTPAEREHYEAIARLQKDAAKKHSAA